MMWWPWSDDPWIVMVWCDMMWMIHQVTIAEYRRINGVWSHPTLDGFVQETFDARFFPGGSGLKASERLMLQISQSRATTPHHSWRTQLANIKPQDAQHCRGSFHLHITTTHESQNSGLLMLLPMVPSGFPQCFQGSCPLNDGKWDGRPGDLSPHHSQHPLCLAGTTIPRAAIPPLGVLSWVLTWSAAASKGSPAAAQTNPQRLGFKWLHSTRGPNISTVLSKNKLRASEWPDCISPSKEIALPLKSACLARQAEHLRKSSCVHFHVAESC